MFSKKRGVQRVSVRVRRREYFILHDTVQDAKLYTYICVLFYSEF